jgi:hypothetical protein
MVSSKKAHGEERLKLNLSLPRSTPSLQPTLCLTASRDCARRSRGKSNAWTVSDDARTSVRYSKLVDRDEILRVLRAFEAAGLEYVLIGAAAMGFHGIVRATEDLDLFIRATPENVEKLRTALRAVYEDDPHIAEITATDLMGEYPAVRYYPPTGDLYFDVLTRLGEAASFETIDAEEKVVNGTLVRVATPTALYRMKKGTVRLQDQADAAALRERFNLRDEE